MSTVPPPPALHPNLPQDAVELPLMALDTDVDKLLEEAAKPVVKRRRAPARPPAAQEPTNDSPPAAAPSAPEDGEVPAIGDLTSGESAASGDVRRATADSILNTERGLKSIGRPLNGGEQKTAAQIRQFIHQARKALTSGDVDGASTLAAKAKVLLGELNE